ncbi:C39 family peptidase [Leuconostocaceae bacterium ESL0723]|nr:C39 family peptidase [Leuconostocaceae bacterium ESL0723]
MKLQAPLVLAGLVGGALAWTNTSASADDTVKISNQDGSPQVLPAPAKTDAQGRVIYLTSTSANQTTPSASATPSTATSTSTASSQTASTAQSNSAAASTSAAGSSAASTSSTAPAANPTPTTSTSAATPTATAPTTTSPQTLVSPATARAPFHFYTQDGQIYYTGGDGQNVTGSWVINGHALNFASNGQLDLSSVKVDLPHQNFNQNQEGAPEGCEGTSFQMALSVKGKEIPTLWDIYARHIGYGWDVPADQGFHGNPFGGSAYQTQTVFAAPLAQSLNGVYGVKTQDMTGAKPADVIVQLLQGNPVITYIPWDLEINGTNNYHVQLITGYENGEFLIADPIPITHPANYRLSTDDWYYLNQNIQPVGYSSPVGMNVAVQ